MSDLHQAIESISIKHKAVQEKLETMNARHKAERADLAAESTRLGKAMAALTGTGRKPMSEEGKAAIKAGLERSRAAKAANVEQTTKPAAEDSAAKPAPVQSEGKSGKFFSR